MLVERAYAKINLTLDVLGKRSDGYHEVDMVMQTVDLSDVIWVERASDRGIVLESSSSQMPLDERNLAYTAARAFLDYTGIPSGVRIGIEKNIPVAAGLAGGSADAAAVLRGLNRLFDTGCSLHELALIGASIGSDVPFCVHGGCAIARGRGESLTPVSHPLHAYAVVIRLPVFVSTADVYQAMTKDDYAPYARSEEMVQALQGGDFSRAQGLVQNGMQRTTERLYPEVKEIRVRVENTVQQPVYMSGSGPTLFLLAPTRYRARRLGNALRGFMKGVHLCRFV